MFKNSAHLLTLIEWIGLVQMDMPLCYTRNKHSHSYISSPDLYIISGYSYYFAITFDNASIMFVFRTTLISFV